MPLERKWRSYSHGCAAVQSSFATYSPLWYLGLQNGSFRHLASFVSGCANSDDNDTYDHFKHKQSAGDKWKVLS